uniref:Uncharacterized protein n=1 Tax=Nicotiana tabacum TaxID=4097 RepID=A0A1S4BGU3_TOBAC|nr:PREDICTED: uncharacterized protein LOC107808098 [Nicotiana tabacum]
MKELLEYLNQKNGRIFSRIDWVFVNGEWMDNMIDCRAKFLPEGVSNHQVTLMHHLIKRKMDFKYCNAWSAHPQFLEIVEDGWNQNIEEWKMFQVVKKLKQQTLYKKIFTNIVTVIATDRANLLRSQELLQQNPMDTKLQQEERILGAKFKRSNYLAEVFLQQRSKDTWISLGDDNTWYFISVIKHKKLVQAVTRLHDASSKLQNDS